MLVLQEMEKRNIDIKQWENIKKYFGLNGFIQQLYKEKKISQKLVLTSFKEHDNEYLEICYYNLKEKYIRGQKDFTKENFDRLKQFVESELGRKL